MFRAQGSSLEHFRESYTDRSTGLVKAWFAAMKKKYPDINTAVSDFIIHLHTVWMFTLFEELLMHAVPKQEMESILHDYILFEIQGWRAIIKVMTDRKDTYGRAARDGGKREKRKSSRGFLFFYS